MSLTPPERETIISMSDADDHWLIHTWQRQLMTKLDTNPSAQKLQEHRYGASRGATYRLPAGLLTFRTAPVHRSMTVEQRTAAGERLAKGRAAKSRWSSAGQAI